MRYLGKDNVFTAERGEEGIGVWNGNCRTRGSKNSFLCAPYWAVDDVCLPGIDHAELVEFQLKTNLTS